MKTVANFPVSWVSKAQDPDISNFKHRSAAFYSKCIFGALTLEVGNFILVSNMDAAEPDSIDGCDVAQILHMYELFSTDANNNRDPCRAIVQWYSRPAGLPKSVTSDENYAFDAREVVEDSRFDPDISIETIFNVCQVQKVPLNSVVKSEQPPSKQAAFFVRYKLVKSSARKWHLEPLIAPPNEARSIRRRTMMTDKTNQLTPRTPKVKITRSKSVENMANLNADQKRMLHDDRWKVKLIDARYDIDQITDSLSEVDLEDDDRTCSPKLRKSSRSSQRFRRNLDDDLGNGQNDQHADCMNYSIVKQKDADVANLKIKLRISETQKHAHTPKSTRKRSTLGSATVDNDVSPPKCRKSLLSGRDDTPRASRKSILKNSSTKASEELGTPKRNVQLSNIVEECAGNHRASRRLEFVTSEAKMVDCKTPKKDRHRGTPSGSHSTSSSAQKMKLIRSGDIKPTIHSRIRPVESGSNDLTIAREQLHVAATPSSLPCREKEYEIIYNFLEGKIFDHCSGCMYVSGVPGTGKTATTTAVIRALKSLSEEEQIPKFDFVDINGMKLTEPRQAYVHIYRQLTGKTLAWEQAYNLLNKRFATKAPRRTTTVLLVDELDVLCNQRQDVVYNLLNWPTLSTAQLIVVTIANTMDLPERMLMGKISSRLGLTRLTFQPYNFRQLQEIVMARLAGTDAFNSDAVQLVSRKVAAVSGDARRALDICRRATELADDQSRKNYNPGQSTMVSILHVQAALAEMIASVHVKTIRSCSSMEQLFLQAVTAEVARTGIEECNFLGVYAQFETLAAFSGISVPNPGRAMMICAKLGASRLLICENSRNDIYQKILLNISSDDVHYALQANKLN
ncbi:origin recognition complex subunit 1 [Anopheles bellator]|uniref:origin recognition complex subunit 1 n=1 Tax=Anopheles bellator TaxID=139047 RepID=UPI0026471CD0|nr:origin recognition complex subunit 1 [Anopheles bellator]